jgi:hypothetical protein
MYRLVKNQVTNDVTSVNRIEDNAFIPFDPANTDYQKYLEWVAAGNTPLPADGE